MIIQLPKIYTKCYLLDSNQQKILVVPHDIGSHTGYSYAAAHPNNVSKLVIMDFIPRIYTSRIR